LKQEVILAARIFDFVPVLLRASERKIHKFEKNVNVFLKDIDMIATFHCGRDYLPENRASLVLQLAKEMLNSHWISISRITVEILCAASLRNFSKVELSAVQVEYL
jgi:hypothetical protein